MGDDFVASDQSLLLASTMIKESDRLISGGTSGSVMSRKSSAPESDSQSSTKVTSIIQCTIGEQQRIGTLLPPGLNPGAVSILLQTPAICRRNSSLTEQ
jgi:hypothetical protein